MLDVLIVEDSADEKETLERCILRYGGEHGETFRITWMQSALEFMEARPTADIIFMDIDMPGLTGMEAAEHLRTYDTATPLVFVTNLAQYAVHGYAVDAVDFIVKPVEYGPFSLRMMRVMRVLSRRSARMIRISVPGEGTRAFPASDVLFIDIDGHYLRYHLAGGEELRLRGSMKQAEEDCAGLPFVRISNSELVNADHVLRVRRDNVELDSGETLWFSRARRHDAQERIVRLMGERRR